MSDSSENQFDGFPQGCGCALMILAVGISIALIILADAIYTGKVPPPW
jgi:hypothetical protein